MNRLTARLDLGFDEWEQIAFKTPDDEQGLYNIVDVVEHRDEEWARQILLSLAETVADYEDTGLTPEQIREIDKLYTEKCQELAELKKNHGFPCTVGDNYILIFNDFGELFITTGWNLTEITVTEDDIILDFYCNETMEDEQRSINSFGKTIFKTKEEAEAKMAEMEGGHEKN